MELNREKVFSEINKAHKELNKLETLVRISRGANTEFEEGQNSMYQSPGAGGGVFDNVINVDTATIKESDGSQRDIVTMHISGQGIEEEDMVLLSKDDCIDLIRYLATAVSLLRD